jgi:hypothetical protein
MKDKFNAIAETARNEDDATYLRNLEIISADADNVWDDDESADGTEEEGDDAVLEVTLVSADGSSKTNSYYVDEFKNAAGNTVKTVTKKEKKAAKKAEKKEKKAEKKVEKKEAKAERKEERKKMGFGKKLVRGFKVANLAPVRLAFMSLAAINIFGIASHLKKVKEAGEKGDAESKKKYDKVKEFWYKMGGDRRKFENMVIKGGARKPFLAKVKKKKGADGEDETIYLFAGDENYNEVMNVAGVDDAAIAAWIGLATAVIAGVKKIAGKPKEMDAETEAAIESDASEGAAEFDAALAEEEKKTVPEALRDVGANTPKWVWFAIGGALLVGGFFLVRAIVKRKK